MEVDPGESEKAKQVEEFAVVDEDAGDEDEPMDEAGGEEEKKVPVNEKGDAEDGVRLINPLFGKDTVPVIDIEDSESSSSEDFSEDVAVENFQKPEEPGAENGESTGEIGKTPLAQCTYDCYQEKGILVNEIERLRKAVFELNERHSVLEDFIEVEYAERFQKFLKNREHLVSMGFGGKDSEGSDDVIDGKRSEKSSELVELLKVIKEQANSGETNDETGASTTPPKPPKATSNPSNAPKPSKNQQKPKSIPSLMSQNTRSPRGDGRGGALSYNQGPMIVPNALAYQYQQQQLIAQQQRQYYESMYGVRDSRDYVTSVPRTPLYPSSSMDHGFTAPGRESKKQRKRKRQSEQSSEASAATRTGASRKDDPDIQVIEQTNASMDTNQKRICPLCEKIMPRKSLRDHLTIVHQGHKVACPVCQAEFMQRRKIKLHMRDAHDMPSSEYTEIIDKIYVAIEEQCGPWLDKIMQEAEKPTKDQLLLHNAEMQMEILAKQSSGGADPSRAPVAKAPPARAPVNNAPKKQQHQPQPSGSRQGGNKPKDNQRRDRGRPTPSQQQAYNSQPLRYFTGANDRISRGYSQSSQQNELYGPGGYAQFAQRYLQQRAASGYY